MGVPCAGRSHSHARRMPVVGRLNTGTSMLACGQPARPQPYAVLQTLCLGQALGVWPWHRILDLKKTCARILATATLQAKSNEANFRERGIVSGHGFTEV